MGPKRRPTPTHLAVARALWVHIHCGQVVRPAVVGDDAGHVDELLPGSIGEGVLHSELALGRVACDGEGTVKRCLQHPAQPLLLGLGWPIGLG